MQSPLPASLGSTENDGNGLRRPTDIAAALVPSPSRRPPTPSAEPRPTPGAGIGPVNSDTVCPSPPYEDCVTCVWLWLPLDPRLSSDCKLACDPLDSANLLSRFVVGTAPAGAAIAAVVVGRGGLSPAAAAAAAAAVAAAARDPFSDRSLPDPATSVETRFTGGADAARERIVCGE